jgi:serine/threonine protein kinase
VIAAETLRKHAPQDRITIVEFINMGGFGAVFKARFHGTLHALKISLDPKEENLEKEIKYMTVNKYPFMPGISYSYKTIIYLVDLYRPVPATGKTMDFDGLITSSVFKAVPAETKLALCAMFFLQMSTAFYYLHQRGVIFNDFKPENIMVDDDGFLNLIDYGLIECVNDILFKKDSERVCMVRKSRSSPCPEGSTINYSGTIHYFSPRVALGMCHSWKDDFWSLATSFYDIMFAEPLVPSMEDDELEDSYKNYGDYCFIDRSTLLRKSDVLYRWIRDIFALVLDKGVTDKNDFYRKAIRVFEGYLDPDAYMSLLGEVISSLKEDSPSSTADSKRELRKRIISGWKACWKPVDKKFEVFSDFRKCLFLKQSAPRA